MTCQASRVGAWPAFDAVFVGSGINSLAGAALLAKDGWRVCVLERNDWLGGAIKTVDGLTAPGFRHEVFSSWHPLWVGSPGLRRAEAGPRPARARVPQHRPADRDRVPGRLERPPLHRRRRQRGRARRRLAAAVRRVHGRLPTIAFGVLGTELWSGQGFSLGRKAYRQFGRRGLVEFAGHSLLSARDWLTDTFDDERAHGLLAPWVLHTGLGPDQAMSGFMTQVIACALQLGGMPVPKGGGVEPRRRAGDDRARRRRRAAHRGGGRADRRLRRARRQRSGSRTARRSRRRPRRARLRHADAALRPPARRGRRAGERPRARAPVPLRPRRDADPHRDERAAALARRRAPRAHASPPPHPRPRRRLARRQRGRPRPAPGRGDDRARPADGRRPVARAGGVVGALGAAAGAAAAAEGRRGRRARRRRRRLDGGAARGVRGPDRRADRPPHREPPQRDGRPRRHVARGHGGREPELGRRRHLRRLLRARPEPPLPPHARDARATRRRSSGSGTSAPAPIPARGSAPAPATSSRSS